LVMTAKNIRCWRKLVEKVNAKKIDLTSICSIELGEYHKML
jgi:hypothetical protein